jgi:hypothetical protein
MSSNQPLLSGDLAEVHPVEKTTRLYFNGGDVSFVPCEQGFDRIEAKEFHWNGEPVKG